MEDTPQIAQMQTFLFPFLASIVFLILHLIVYWGLFYRLSNSKTIRFFFKAFTTLNFGGTIAYMFVRQYPLLPEPLYLLLSISIGVVFSLFVAAVIYQFLGIFIRFVSSKNKRTTYRKYLQRSVIALSVIYIGYGIYNGNRTPVLKNISIPIANLSTPLKIVQLSDVHIGGLIEESRVKNIVQLVNEENPDIIVLTGDIVDTRLKNVARAVDELGNLRARYGVYYVLGNHEYLHDIDNIIEKMKELGFHVLINQNVLISQNGVPLINIAGNADLMGKRMGYLEPDLDKTFAGIESSVPTILLSHQPKIIEKLQNKPVDVILSGHTHGGQIFPFSLAVLLQQPYLMGLHKIGENRYVYINQGTGFWGPPMRVGTHSEISIIKLFPKT
ncbi:metallophosphoesterase [Helicobacter sp. 11S02596-1]|uniref:metallophosphoesterase n=1 Tax=Helicobacter sp. 11S02596-1 TaxID=1476194 RepID=UPI000BA50D56|nr:metallophosphoesterase [Helicobacter sp. 11S02596-1]